MSETKKNETKKTYNGKPIYNKKEFAALIGVSTQSLRRYEKENILVPYKTITGMTYYTNDHYEKYFNVDKQKP